MPKSDKYYDTTSACGTPHVPINRLAGVKPNANCQPLQLRDELRVKAREALRNRFEAAVERVEGEGQLSPPECSTNSAISVLAKYAQQYEKAFAKTAYTPVTYDEGLATADEEPPTADPGSPDPQPDDIVPVGAEEAPAGTDPVDGVGVVGGVGLLGGGKKPTPKAVPLERFPVDVFPTVVRNFISSISSALPCPVDFPGVMMLPVLGTCIGRKRSIQIKPRWVEHPQIWAVSVGRSGDRKTPAFKEVTRPLHERQRQLIAEYETARRNYEAQSSEDRKCSAPPRLKRTHTTDATVESLKNVLASNPDGVCYLADELSGWVRGMGQYKGGKGNDRQNWLSIWSGTPVLCDRAGRPDPIVINHPFVGVTGGIQPDCLDDLIDDSRDDGGAARVLIGFPDAATRTDWTDESVAFASEYDSVCRNLMDLEASDMPLVLAPASKRAWVEWVNTHRKSTPPEALGSAWSKCEGYSLRLALVLFLTRQVCGETKGGDVDIESINGATALISYFKSHAIKAYSHVESKASASNEDRYLKWVKKQWANGKTVTSRLMQMNGVVKTADEAKQALLALADLGHGKAKKNDGVMVTLVPLVG